MFALRKGEDFVIGQQQTRNTLFATCKFSLPDGLDNELSPAFYIAQKDNGVWVSAARDVGPFEISRIRLLLEPLPVDQWFFVEIL